MKSILSIISPITLCVGHNPKTAETGKGCLLDICSYLNGDAVITDHTDCVHPLIRPLAAITNDFSDSSHRAELIKLIPRLMVTANLTSEQQDTCNAVLAMFHSYQEATIRKVRESIGLDYGTYQYGYYLREKLSWAIRGPEQAYEESAACQTALQYGWTMQYLDQAFLDAKIYGALEIVSHIQEVRIDLQERALRCLTDMLPKEVLVETSTHFGRAQQLVDTKLAVLPV